MMANKSGWKNQQSKHQRRNHHLREIILAILVVLSVAATVCPYSAQAGDTEGIGFRLQSISRDDLFRR